MENETLASQDQITLKINQLFDNSTQVSSVSELFENVLASEQVETFLHQLLDQDQSTARQCSNDPFAIFGFLAFLLVLLQLLANTGGRRKRSAENCSRLSELSAVKHVMKGFLQALQFDDGE